MVNRDQMNWLLEANDPDQYASSDEYVEAIKAHAREDHDSDLTIEQIKEAHQQWEDVRRIGEEEG